MIRVYEHTQKSFTSLPSVSELMRSTVCVRPVCLKSFLFPLICSSFHLSRSCKKISLLIITGERSLSGDGCPCLLQSSAEISDYCNPFLTCCRIIIRIILFIIIIKHQRLCYIMYVFILIITSRFVCWMLRCFSHTSWCSMCGAQ